MGLDPVSASRHLLWFILAVGSAWQVGAQQPVHLCIVEAQHDRATHYDPSAGPWSIAMNNELAGRKLRDGSPLKITVFPATIEKEIPREARRLQCEFVVQIWHNQVPDVSGNSTGVSSGENFSSLNPLQAGPGPINSQDSLFFSLWKVATGKSISSGSAPIHPRTAKDPPNLPPDSPCTSFARQTIKRLNQVR